MREKDNQAVGANSFTKEHAGLYELLHVRTRMLELWYSAFEEEGYPVTGAAQSGPKDIKHAGNQEAP